MSLVNSMYAQSLRPIGDVSMASDFVVIVPPVGSDYIPVLLHCDYKNISKATHEVLKHMLECGTPPIIVLTYGNKTNIGSAIVSYLVTHGIAGLFSSVLSMNNERFGFLHGFATYWNNLPFQLEEDLASIKELGKYTDVGNGLAEAIGSLLDKPVVSTHFVGCEQDYIDIKDFLAVMATEYPDYNYNSAANYPGNFTRPARDNRCVCCHKAGNNLAHYPAINGKLCPACVRRMRERKGGISILNWYRLGIELKIERMNTRSANMRKLWMAEPKCTECGTKLTHQGFHEYHCDNCDTTLWYKNAFYYKVTTDLGKRFVRKISDDGKALAGSWTLEKCPELMECDVCRHLAVDFAALYEASTNTTRIVCKRCRNKGLC